MNWVTVAAIILIGLVAALNIAGYPRRQEKKPSKHGTVSSIFLKKLHLNDDPEMSRLANWFLRDMDLRAGAGSQVAWSLCSVLAIYLIARFVLHAPN